MRLEESEADIWKRTRLSISRIMERSMVRSMAAGVSTHIRTCMPWLGPSRRRSANCLSGWGVFSSLARGGDGGGGFDGAGIAGPGLGLRDGGGPFRGADQSDEAFIGTDVGGGVAFEDDGRLGAALVALDEGFEFLVDAFEIDVAAVV